MPVDPAQQFDVAISGASFAGLALARALRQEFGSDISIALIDPLANVPIKSGDVRASAISAASVHMLDALGVWPAVAAHAEAVSRIEITDSKLGDAIRAPLLTYDNTLPDGGPATFIVPNTVLHSALRAGLDTQTGIAFITSPVTGIDVSTHHARLNLACGASVSARLTVAADGRHSPLRAAAGIKCIGWDYDQIGIVTRVDLEIPHEGTAVQHFLPGGPFAILPLQGPHACITWSEDKQTAQHMLALESQAFAAEVQRRSGGRFGRLTAIAPPQHWPLALNVARELRKERLAVIGDAAHSVHPIAGQGLNLAFRDAAALSQVVADALKLGLDPGAQSILDQYQSWRRFDVAQSSAAYDGLNRFFRNDAMLARAARSVGLGIIDQFAPLKKLLVSEAAGLTGTVPRLLAGRQ